ncbi:hypothetical protein JNMOADIG_00115 [Aeromonas phage avDM5]|uniref:Nudix hydrolase domain-containing protein n=1 Tax=Aeromonas phage vB_AehM_DM2 TaxID=2973716 RepID=A0AA95C3Z5_9CAUD|nr:hypothetical protein JNMOADIG_00115 [Aeromonas phage avDM5]UYD60382.1 hypothetical protein NPHMPGLK_00047 [Aeromonas phage avDM2]UYD60782.1 hypothetical protein NHNEHLNL_00186 [Aeromonas phage avDM2]
MTYDYDRAVVIGRFSSFFHRGHEMLIYKALQTAENVAVVFGSSHCYPNTINPLPTLVRVRMFKEWMSENLTPYEQKRVTFGHVPDYRYNEDRWQAEVREQAGEKAGEKVAMVAYDKDADSYWIRSFGWDHIQCMGVQNHGADISNTPMRDEFLRTGVINGAFPINPTVRSFLSTYWNTEGRELRDRLMEERQMWDNELAKFENYPYREALNCNTADTVVTCNNHILLIERKHAPGKDALALPGGHKNANETFQQCAVRELFEEVKIEVKEKDIIGSIKAHEVFDHPKRTAEFCKPTVAYYIVLSPGPNGELPAVNADDDAKAAFWMPMHIYKKNRARMFDDHAEIISRFTGI